MSHNFSTEVSGSYPSMMHVQKELTYAHNRILKLYKEQSNLSEKYIVEHLIGPYDYYLEPKEALELGLADSIE
jgi:ATP-dependent protease ClpP protease subunit